MGVVVIFHIERKERRHPFKYLFVLRSSQQLEQAMWQIEAAVIVEGHFLDILAGIYCL